MKATNESYTYLQHEVLIGLEGETNIIRHFSRLCMLRPSKHYLALQWGNKCIFENSIPIVLNLIVAHGMMLAVPSVSEASFFGFLAFAEDHVVRLDPWTILAKGREGDSIDSLIEASARVNFVKY